MMWKKDKIDNDMVREFSGRFGVDLLTASILVRRGITEFEDVMYFLESDFRYTYNPFLFAEMEDAVDRISRAVEEGEKILIFGDRDVDGITSTVLLFQELSALGLEVEWALPLGDDPYGLTVDAVETFARKDGTLILTVDCGISNHQEIARAQELGIDTIVVDHHNPHATIPPAFAIINPKLEDSGYPFEGLAGCAVVSKLIWALRFSKTVLYNHPVCLLNIRPANETYVIEAVKLINFVETDRVVENIVPGVMAVEQTRLYRFLADQEIYVYDEAVQTKAFHRVFGNSVEVHFLDAAPEIWKIFPQLSGKSLLRMREVSRMARYQKQLQSEMDIFINLFISFFYAKEKSLSEGFAELLDLVALGTLADLMPLRSENRILVKLGMEVLNKGQRPGLHELLFKQGLLLKKVGTKDIAWQIAPLVNATGRMGVPDKAVRLFLSEDPKEREMLAEEIVGLNKERKSLGERAWKSVLDQAQKSFRSYEERLVVVSGDDIHRGVTGIIASRLVNYFGTTSVVVSVTDGTAVGSVRSSGTVNVKELLVQCAHLFTDYGGHDFAAGFSMPKERIGDFEKEMQKAVRAIKPVSQEEETLSIDAELPVKYMTPSLIKTVELFEPYGEGNDPLVFLLKNVTITDLSLVGKTEKQHVRMVVEVGANKWPAVFWNASERVGVDFSQGDRVNIAFRLGRNYFQNTETLQLTILDILK